MIRLRVFGSVELCADDGRELRTVLAQPKRFALLAYLAVATPSGFQRRDRLLALFWPEYDDAHARGALNAAVRFLRREMGRDAIANRGSDEIGIDPSVCWCDVAAFHRALEGGRHAEALSLYRGDLLDGFFTDGAASFDDWLERERAQLRAAAARAARALAEQCEREQNVTTALSCARRAVELADSDERMFRQLLEMLERLGDRAGALLAYETFERRLAAEYETKPAPETTALIARIRNGASVGLAARPASSAAPFDASPGGLAGWRVERELGRGGMATVYLARDVAHERYVALKLMRPELALSAGVEHFLREIQFTARLAHPHILPLIDSGARDGVPYLVTPYVVGESLRGRLTHERTLPLREALRIATEIAEALDYAHRSGIVHRDLKPENVLLADGHAVVADFGVARALVASGAVSQLGSTDESLEPTIVGSRGYMSPEQAAGNADADARADLYSLGCVLFEMLTGEAPNKSDEAGERLAAQKSVPPAVRRLVRELLEAAPNRRPSSAGHVLSRLEELNVVGGAASHATRRRNVRILAIGGGGLLTGLLVLYTATRTTNAWSAAVLGATTQVTNTPGLELDPAISPEGKLIAYAAGTPGRMRIYVRPVSGGNAIAVSNESMFNHRWPTWSPDGSQLAFLAGGDGNEDSRLYVASALGGSQRLIAEGLSSFSTPSWSPNGKDIAYPLLDSIVIRDAKSGAARGISARPRMRKSSGLTKSSSIWAIHSLSWSPDGRRLAFVSGNPGFAFGTLTFGNLGPSSIWIIALDGSPPHRLTTGPYTFGSPIWTPDGRGMLYVSNAGGAWDVYHQAIDASALPDGEPKRLTTGLNAHGIGLTRDGSFLAYSLVNSRSNIFAAPIPVRGVTLGSAVRRLTNDNQTVETVDVSPDGKWLAFESNRGGAGRSHIYKMSVPEGELVQLTDGLAENFAPKWSPDGRQIAFHTREPTKDGLRDVFVVSADGGQQTRITADSLDHAYPNWSPDGKRLIFSGAPIGAMAAELRADGRWTAPERDSSDERRVIRRGPDFYVRPDRGPLRLLFSARQLGGGILTSRVNGDGTVLYVRTVDSAGVHSFYSVPLTGGTPRLVVRLDDRPHQMARLLFAAGASHLYFTLTEAESDIWVVALRK